MKSLISNLNKAFENRVRLGIMSLLMVEEKVDFKTLKQHLDVSDGNLATHIKGLEKNDYIKVNKKFIDNKPNTSYEITKTGRSAFLEHIQSLEKLIKSNQ